MERNAKKNPNADNRQCSDLHNKMEHTGFEPVTSTLPVWRAPSCANAPKREMEAKGLEPLTSR